jgi:mono/diheme cytochrome c family protein
VSRTSAEGLEKRWQWLGLAVVLVAVLAAVLLKASSLPATAAPAAPASAAQTDPTQDGPSQEAQQLALGASVFSRACTSCHQVGGVGLPGQFPPLKGNPNVTDAAYVEQTVRAGKQGPIVVNGVDYNGVMPVVGASLSDEDIAAVAAYIAADLTLPPGVDVVAPVVPSMPGPPDVSLGLVALGFLVAGVVGAIVVGPLVLGRNDQLELSWVDAGLKSVIVIGYFIVAGLIIPGRLMELEQVTELDRELQYVLGATVWGGGMLIGLVALWWAGRKGLL